MLKTSSAVFFMREYILVKLARKFTVQYVQRYFSRTNQS